MEYNLVINLKYRWPASQLDDWKGKFDSFWVIIKEAVRYTLEDFQPNESEVGLPADYPCTIWMDKSEALMAYVLIVQVSIGRVV